jgi:hypothetical protein
VVELPGRGQWDEDGLRGWEVAGDAVVDQLRALVADLADGRERVAAAIVPGLEDRTPAAAGERIGAVLLLEAVLVLIEEVPALAAVIPDQNLVDP